MWSRKKVSEITGIPDRRVLFYTEQPGILPEIEQKVGSGYAREYTLKDIIVLAFVRELNLCGFSLSRIKEFLFHIRDPEIESKWWNSAKAEPVTDKPCNIIYYHDGRGGRTIGIRQTDQPAPLMNRHTSAIIISMTNIINDILQKIT
ncbi:DNA-binding transcriptional MerR regulator [Desulfosalsimonas propionicica]|uniref:DNA-binding transcriptional MerR regulator n=1 Tax=Desulfosalsimonas propionicica TaxID=332175 RepID=A0A7W0CA00_9BACT|nr:MerR family transcriptional regulator [Desulfosalsimonas propionicica]MBA2881906.1 DNA-binding transcriptional MerR regulator [Desulfosalsimonas propionicica]